MKLTYDFGGSIYGEEQTFNQFGAVDAENGEVVIDLRIRRATNGVIVNTLVENTPIITT